ncbi:MAG TPA: hypothetical protein P5280_15880, partial [Cyclobacteriaceae bacterium]|nr:hypothetical protein [Cyclobacteriaceae bacterium]
VAHSFSGLHNVQEKQWVEKIQHMLASISRVCSPNRARNVFLCVYLAAHYWWDFYISEDNIAQPLLDIWEKSHIDLQDQELVRLLQQLSRNYPPEREFFRRESIAMRYRWKKVAEAATRLIENLRTDIPEPERNTAAYRYAQALLNVYLVGARTIYTKANQEPDDGEVINLLEESEEMLWENNDPVHAVWLVREICETHFRLGKQYLSLASIRSQTEHKIIFLAKSAEHFQLVQTNALRGIKLSVEEALSREDSLDLEVIANFFRVLADVTWEKDHNIDQPVFYQSVAVFLAFIWLGDEWDIYSYEFLNEQVERFLVWLETVNKLEPGMVSTALNLMNQFWQDQPLTAQLLDTYLEPGNWKSLKGSILPKGPSKLDVSGELTNAYEEERRVLIREIPQNFRHFQNKRIDPRIFDALESIRKQYENQ